MDSPTRLASDPYDVVILGAGLAGLGLARHLLLETDVRVLVLEKRDVLPQERQKVGESSVQLAGYYFSKVLDLEEYLLHEHFMKYNLRFYWRSAGRSNESFEDYSAAYIRPFSNIASYQLDRNRFEGELLRRNRQNERFACLTAVSALEVDLDPSAVPTAGPTAGPMAGPEASARGSHVVRYEVDGETHQVAARWVVDTTGRRKLLAKKRELTRPNSIRHGAFFWWVDGLVDIEKLTSLDRTERRRNPDRRHTGHLPSWLATNHFCDEGLWFWVIPLRGKTSLGLVFDHEVVHWRDVFTPEKATRWVCERFPLFARDLPQRDVVDFGGYKDFSYDCAQTISATGWAMAGESGRFTDPLYSPGSDLIAIHNTLIVDAIRTTDADELRAKCQLYESMMKAVYQAYVPTYATSYDCLGDQECFSLKYGWELAIYFGVYVFPFLNDLFTDRRFAIGFLRQFSRLGPWNRTVQALLSDFFHWKNEHLSEPEGPRFFDFMELGTLRAAEKTFYEVGVDAGEAKRILSHMVDQLEEMARFVAVHVAAVVLDEPTAYENRAFVESFDLETTKLDREDFARRWQECRDVEGTWEWSFDIRVLDRFRARRRATSDPTSVDPRAAESTAPAPPEIESPAPASPELALQEAAR